MLTNKIFNASALRTTTTCLVVRVYTSQSYDYIPFSCTTIYLLVVRLYVSQLYDYAFISFFCLVMAICCLERGQFYAITRQSRLHGQRIRNRCSFRNSQKYRCSFLLHITLDVAECVDKQNVKTCVMSGFTLHAHYTTLHFFQKINVKCKCLHFECVNPRFLSRVQCGVVCVQCQMGYCTIVNR